jgi:uncharacterized protein (TIGR02996 family)
MPPILHPQAAAFLRAIQERPEEDAPRLIYADWLTEQGDADRAEFIRLQIDLERLPADDERLIDMRKRAAAMEKKRGKGWLPAALLALNPASRKYVRDWRYRRGFLDSLLLLPRRAGLVTAAADALALEPLRCLSISHDAPLEPYLAEAAATPHLGWLRALEIDGSLTPEALGPLAASPHLGRLTELRLCPRWWASASAADAEALAGTPLGRRLTSLALQVRQGEAPGVVRALTAAPGFPALESLSLARGNLSGDEVGRLAASPRLAKLTGLELDDDRGVGPEGVAALVHSPLWSRLERLSLKSLAIGDEGAGLIAEALPRSPLRELRLRRCDISPKGISRLAAAPSWGRLEALDLSVNDVGSTGAEALAGSPRLAQLRSLDLEFCSMRSAGSVFVTSPHVDGLRRLLIREGGAMPRGLVPALLNRFGPRFHRE